jgi:hypothetical protein
MAKLPAVEKSRTSAGGSDDGEDAERSQRQHG